MMALINAKKLRPIAAFILVLALVITYAVPMTMTAYAADPPVGSTKNFKVTMFDYNQTTVNSANKYSGSGNDPNAILFGKVGNQPYNAYTGGTSVYTGIAQNSLSSNGKIQFNNINSIDLFSSSSSYYDSWTDVDFPFYYDGNYYSFDSNSKKATFNASGNNIQLSDWPSNVTSAPAKGFWPFGSEQYYFGMKMEVEFYIPENRTADGTVNGADLVFNFRGDDDVWIFIDDKLVLDLGGIHQAASGSINFTTGVIGNPSRASGTPAPDSSLSNDFGANFKTKKFAASTVHTMKVFYLERGAGESNFKMSFNIPPVEPVTVEKKLESSNGFTTDSNFDFIIKTGKNKPGLQPFENQPYQIQSTNGSLRSATTDSNGKFALKNGEKAIFSTIADKDWFSIEEVTEGLYNCEWTATNGLGLPEQAGGDNVIIGKFKYGEQPGRYALLCTNTFVTTNVEFSKTDAVTGAVVPAAAFELTAVSGASGFTTAYSDENGKVLFSGIPIGVYYLTEILAPTGYYGLDEVYTVVVDYFEPDQTPKSKPPQPKPELGFKIYNESEEPINTIYNDPKFINLTITKKVQGSHAPENASPADVVYYPFTITFEDGFYLADTNSISSQGAFDLQSRQYEYRGGSQETTTYEFTLVKDGYITFPIREGVHYSVFEGAEDGDYKPYFIMTGDGADVIDDGTGIYSQMSTTSALTVLNQYRNDGLTVLKLVSGNQAPESEDFDFTARFWTPESDEAMETTLMSRAQLTVDEATDALATASALMTDDDWSALEEAEQAVNAAAATLAAANADLEAAQSAYDDAEAALEAASILAAELQAEIDATTDEAIIADLEARIDALDIASLEADKLVKGEALQDAQDAYDDAVSAKEEADAALAALKTTPGVIKDYLDAQDALAAAQDDYDDKNANKEKSIFKMIWERVVDFFINLVVGDTYEYGVTDIVYSGNATGFEYDETTSECAFSLGISDSITFNFDQYFEDHPAVDKIFFEIAEVDAAGAKEVKIETEDDPFPSSGFGTDNPAAAGRTIKGYVERDTMNPMIVYTNDYGNVYTYEYIVYHKTNTGEVLASSTAIGIVGASLNLSPQSFSGYGYTTVAAVGMTINPDSDGKIVDVLGEKPEVPIIITYVYTRNNDDENEGGDDDDSDGGGGTTTTITPEAVPAAPVELEDQMLLDEAVPAAPLPQTGGVPALLLYGLGALLAGGGATLKLRNKKNNDNK